MIGDPPSLVGAVKLTSTCVSPGVTESIVGADGAVGLRDALGVTLFEGPEVVLIPAAFFAVTVNVYAVPFVNPNTVIGELRPVASIPPGDDVTV